MAKQTEAIYDEQFTAFQYVDWLFEGDDIIAACRTAFNGAHSYHDANYITFHRIANYHVNPALAP